MARPTVAPSIMSSEYDDSIWQMVPDRDRAPDPRFSELIEQFAGGGNAILDLGCGDGRYLPTLAAAGSGPIHAADRSAVALERAGRRLPSAVLHQVGADERLPIDDNAIRQIWCCDTLEHVIDTQTVLSEARRVLHPGGSMIVVTPDHRLSLRLRLALGGWERHFDPFSPHLRFYTARSLRDALVDCGFEPPGIKRIGDALVAKAARI